MSIFFTQSSSANNSTISPSVYSLRFLFILIQINSDDDFQARIKNNTFNHCYAVNYERYELALIAVCRTAPTDYALFVGAEMYSAIARRY